MGIEGRKGKKKKTQIFQYIQKMIGLSIGFFSLFPKGSFLYVCHLFFFILLSLIIDCFHCFCRKAIGVHLWTRISKNKTKKKEWMIVFGISLLLFLMFCCVSEFSLIYLIILGLESYIFIKNFFLVVDVILH